MDERILVIDDDPTVRSLISRAIDEAGFLTEVAASAEEGLVKVKSGTFDVVIADIVLPGMSGLDLVDKIRKEDGVDVIIVTGYGHDHSYSEAVSRGASDFVLKPVRAEELILRLRRVLQERELRYTRSRMLEELKKLVITDSLTGLFNSRHFFNQIKSEMARSGRYNHNLTLMLLDIDRFKDYNDTYGHLRGDQVLARIGEIIQLCLRSADSAYRYGGEEFTVLLPETTAREGFAVAERIRDAVASEAFIPVEGKTCHVTTSIGLTEHLPSESEQAFIQRADAAMYRSKEMGRNSVTVAPVEDEPESSVE